MNIKIIKQLSTIWEYKLIDDDRTSFYIAKVLATFDDVEYVTMLCVPVSVVVVTGGPKVVSYNYVTAPAVFNTMKFTIGKARLDFQCVSESSIVDSQVLSWFNNICDNKQYETKHLSLSWLLLDEIK